MIKKRLSAMLAMILAVVQLSGLSLVPVYGEETTEAVWQDEVELSQETKGHLLIPVIPHTKYSEEGGADKDDEKAADYEGAAKYAREKGIFTIKLHYTDKLSEDGIKYADSRNDDASIETEGKAAATTIFTGVFHWERNENGLETVTVKDEAENVLYTSEGEALDITEKGGLYYIDIDLSRHINESGNYWAELTSAGADVTKEVIPPPEDPNEEVPVPKNGFSDRWGYDRPSQTIKVDGLKWDSGINGRAAWNENVDASAYLVSWNCMGHNVQYEENYKTKDTANAVHTWTVLNAEDEPEAIWKPLFNFNGAFAATDDDYFYGYTDEPYFDLAEPIFDTIVCNGRDVQDIYTADGLPNAGVNVGYYSDFTFSVMAISRDVTTYANSYDTFSVPSVSYESSIGNGGYEISNAIETIGKAIDQMESIEEIKRITGENITEKTIYENLIYDLNGGSEASMAGNYALKLSLTQDKSGKLMEKIGELSQEITHRTGIDGRTEYKGSDSWNGSSVKVLNTALLAFRDGDNTQEGTYNLTLTEYEPDPYVRSGFAMTLDKDYQIAFEDEEKTIPKYIEKFAGHKHTFKIDAPAFNISNKWPLIVKVSGFDDLNMNGTINVFARFQDYNNYLDPLSNYSNADHASGRLDHRYMMTNAAEKSIYLMPDFSSNYYGDFITLADDSETYSVLGRVGNYNVNNNVLASNNPQPLLKKNELKQRIRESGTDVTIEPLFYNDVKKGDSVSFKIKVGDKSETTSILSVNKVIEHGKLLRSVRNPNYAGDYLSGNNISGKSEEYWEIGKDADGKDLIGYDGGETRYIYNKYKYEFKTGYNLDYTFKGIVGDNILLVYTDSKPNRQYQEVDGALANAALKLLRLAKYHAVYDEENNNYVEVDPEIPDEGDPVPQVVPVNENALIDYRNDFVLGEKEPEINDGIADKEAAPSKAAATAAGKIAEELLNNLKTDREEKDSFEEYQILTDVLNGYIDDSVLPAGGKSYDDYKEYFNSIKDLRGQILKNIDIADREYQLSANSAVKLDVSDKLGVNKDYVRAFGAGLNSSPNTPTTFSIAPAAAAGSADYGNSFAFSIKYSGADKVKAGKDGKFAFPVVVRLPIPDSYEGQTNGFKNLGDLYLLHTVDGSSTKEIIKPRIIDITVKDKDEQETGEVINAMEFTVTTEGTFSIVEDFIVETVAGPGGSITPGRFIPVKKGESLTVKVEPAIGFMTDYVAVSKAGGAEEKVSLQDGKYTLENIDANYKITASFNKYVPPVPATVSMTNIQPAGETGYRVEVSNRVSFNGVKHIEEGGKTNKNKAGDVKVVIYDPEGKEVPKNEYKLNFKNNFNATPEGSDNKAYFTINLKGKRHKSVKNTIKAIKFTFTIAPADLGVIKPKAEGAGFNGKGKFKMKKLSYTAETGKEIKLKEKKSNGKGDYEFQTPPTSDMTSVSINGVNNYCGSMVVNVK